MTAPGVLGIKCANPRGEARVSLGEGSGLRGFGPLGLGVRGSGLPRILWLAIERVMCFLIGDSLVPEVVG